MRCFLAAMLLACASLNGAMLYRPAEAVPVHVAEVRAYPVVKVEVAALHPPAMPVWIEPAFWAEPMGSLSEPVTARLLAVASASVGKGPRALGVRLDLWCADAINAWLRKIGVKGTGSQLASSFRTWGKPTKPAPGVVAVKPRRGGSGHVVVVQAVKGNRIVAISPNGGGNRVRVHVYPLRAFDSFRTASL